MKKLKKEVKRPYKRKKPIESFVDELPEIESDLVEETPVVPESPVVPDVSDVPVKKEHVTNHVQACDCGKPVHPGSHQCWSCSHRS